MKKTIVWIMTIAFLVSLFPTGSVRAASLPTCSIATWQVLYNGAWISGGCTCHVAERVRATTGKLVPNWHNAGSWWGATKWLKNTNEPRIGAIAAYSGHVAYVEGITLKSTSTPAVVRTATYTLNWIKYSATLYKVTETYSVRLSQKDFSRIKIGDNSIRTSSFVSKRVKYYWVSKNLQKLDSVSYRPLPTTPGNTWTTPRTGSATSLYGFIYP